VARKKRKKGKRRRRCKHPCDCGWKVNWTAEFRIRARELGIWGDVRSELRDLEGRLRDPALRSEALEFLMSQPVVAYYPFGGKRYLVRRMYFGRQTARAGFVVRSDICRVWFVALVPRTDSTYKNKRWG